MVTSPHGQGWSRRAFLRKTLGGAVILGGGGLLSACSGADDTTTAAGTSGPTVTPGAATPSATPSATASAAAGGGRITIGTSDALTGDFASIGTWQNRGVLLAIEDYTPRNFEGVDLVTLDNRGDPTEAVAVYNRLVEEEGVPIVLGGFSNLSQAVAPIAARTETVYINCQAPLDALQGLPFVYNTQPLTNQEMDILANWYSEQGYQRMAAIFSTEFDGPSAVDALTAAFEALGGEAVASQSHEGGAVDFATQVAIIADANPDVIHVHSPFDDAARVMRQLRENGLEQQLTSYRGFESPSVFEIGGEALEGMVLTQTLFDTSDPEVAAIAERYRELYDEEMNPFVAVKYDAAWVALEAIDLLMEAGQEVTGITLDEALVGPTFGTPLSGPTTLTEDGVVTNKPMALKTVQDGAFVQQEVLEG